MQVTASPYAGRPRRLAAVIGGPIGSQYKFSEVQAQHWMQFAESVGLTQAQAKRRILELATANRAQSFRRTPNAGHLVLGKSLPSLNNAP